MELVGFYLFKIEDDSVVQTWGGVYGRCPGFPEYIALPNNYQIYVPELETEYHGYKIIKWFMESPPPVIQDISDRQFFQQANVSGIITQSEALAAVATGTIPNTLVTIINTIPDENERFSTQMILTGATTFSRNHPLTISVGTALGLTDEQIDQFFLAAAQL